MRYLLSLLFALLIASNALSLSYRGNSTQRGHREDFRAVLPFVWDSSMEEWGKTVTNILDQFDRGAVSEYGGMSTYDYWKEKYGLKMSVGIHRYFFHWGYQRQPWSDDILRYLPNVVKDNPIRLDEFKEAVKAEQKRRNKLANLSAEKTLGFDSTGRQASYANAFVAILYDVHILGDYETPNIDGLAPVKAITSEIIQQLETIDRLHYKSLASDLRQIVNQTSKNQRELAAEVLSYLKEKLPRFIYEADDGKVCMKRHFEMQGIVFRQEIVNGKTAELNNKMGLKSEISSHGEWVVITPKGACYHKPSCSNMRNKQNLTRMTVAEAEARNRRAAQCCHRKK